MLWVGLDNEWCLAIPPPREGTERRVGDKTLTILELVCISESVCMHVYMSVYMCSQYLIRPAEFRMATQKRESSGTPGG